MVQYVRSILFLLGTTQPLKLDLSQHSQADIFPYLHSIPPGRSKREIEREIFYLYDRLPTFFRLLFLFMNPLHDLFDNEWSP
jgi:hypothetical protein